MPLLTVTRFLATLASLAVLGACLYLLWSWWDGDYVRASDGAVLWVREDWRLWTGLGLVALSFLGRIAIVPLLARGVPSERFERGSGRTIAGARSPALYVDTSGPDAAPLILLTHGQGMDTTFWSPIRGHLSKQYRVVAWDLPGLGRSKRTPGSRLSLDDAAADLGAVLKTLEGPLVLVGHSLGGMTVQHLARQNPDLFARSVLGVVLLNTTYTNPLHTMMLSKLARALQRPVLEPMSHVTKWIEPLAWAGNWQSYLSGWAHVANRIQFAGEVTQDQLEHVTLVGTRNPPGVIEAGNLGMFHWRGLDEGAIKVPVLVIAGGKDIVTKEEASEAIVAKLSDARLKVVAEANHMGPIEQARIYSGAIERFASEVFRQPAIAK